MGLASPKKVIAFTSIKENSERLPRKNFRKLGDSPLYNIATKTVVDSRLFDEVYFLANADLELDLVAGVQRIAKPTFLDHSGIGSNEIVRFMVSQIDSSYYLYFNVTTPFLSTPSLEEMIAITRDEGSRFDSALTGQIPSPFIWKNGKPLTFSPNRILPTQFQNNVFMENSGAYLFGKRDGMRGRRVGRNPKFVHVTWPETIDIDNEEEWQAALAQTLFQPKTQDSRGSREIRRKALERKAR